MDGEISPLKTWKKRATIIPMAFPSFIMFLLWKIMLIMFPGLLPCTGEVGEHGRLCG
jgi:hypothetical protein